MRVLGIETSCDETAAAVLDIDEQKIDVLSNIVSSQMGIHKPYGGVVPEMAARQHAQHIHEIVQKALEGTPARDGSDIDLVAVTQGPGLKTSLLVGTTAAQTLAASWHKPVVGVNHLEGHVLSPFIEHEMYPPSEQNDFPMVVLTVSGGHTQIKIMREIGDYEILGSTIDDAAGEAFDKVSKMLGLGYPGGPVIDKLAKHGNPKAYDFPRPMEDSGDFRFSFSGLKTAVKYKLEEIGELTEETQQDVAASFQRAVVDILVRKTMKAAKKYQAKTVFLAGGVGANSELRETLEASVKRQLSQPKADAPRAQNVNCIIIDRRYSGDNAAMIAVAGYFTFLRQNRSPEKIHVDPKLDLPKK